VYRFTAAIRAELIRNERTERRLMGRNRIPFITIRAIDGDIPF
jgi:hypothetical protein